MIVSAVVADDPAQDAGLLAAHMVGFDHLNYFIDAFLVKLHLHLVFELLETFNQLGAELLLLILILKLHRHI